MKWLASAEPGWQNRPTHLKTRLRAHRKGDQPMDSIGLDLHKRESQLCILTAAGEVLEQRIVTSRERFAAVLGERPPARVLLAAATESGWVGRHPQGLRDEPNHA